MGDCADGEAKDCIMFSTADWNEPYWTNKQHTSMELMRQDWRILYIESVGLRSPNFQSKKDWSRLLVRLYRGLFCLFFGARKVEKAIWVLSPLMVPAAHRYNTIRKLNNLLLVFSIRRFNKSNKTTDPVIWTYHPYIFSVLSALKYCKLVYHNVDDNSAVPGIDTSYYQQQEELLVKKADVVFVTMETLRKRCAKWNKNTYFHPNVVDYEHFSQAITNADLPNHLSEISKPIVIYHGVLSDFKLDFELLYRAAQLRKDLNWVLIGEEREGQSNKTLRNLSKLPNVKLVGYVPYDKLPSYLKGADIGVLPSLINHYTDGMFPMKYFEYIASGLPVVSTPLAFTKIVNAGLEIGENTDSFLQAINAQLKRKKLTPDESKAIIADNSWRERTIKMLEILKASNN